MALIQANFESACLDRMVPFNAILPLDRMSLMHEPAAPPLKTLYLLHGYMGGASDWLTNSELGCLAAQNGLAIILPDAENHFYIDDMKRRDMYGAFIGQELVNYTRRIFPLSDRREDTIIGGVAMGGYGALRNGMKYSDVFGQVIAISPANIIHRLPESTDEPNFIGATRGYYESVFGDLNKAAESDVDLHWLVKTLHREGKAFPEIYITCGYNDMLVYESRRLDGHLSVLGVPHTYEESQGAHEPAFFNACLRRALERLPLDRPETLPDPFWVDHDSKNNP